MSRAPQSDSLAEDKAPVTVSDPADGWMDEIPDEADGMIVRRGAIDSAARTPFSSGIRPVAPVRREEPVRRAEPARRENLYKQEEPAYQEDNDR